MGPGDSTVSKGAISILQGRIWSQVGSREEVLSPEDSVPLEDSAWWEISMVWNSILVWSLVASQWSGTCLSYTLKVVYFLLLDLLISVLAPLKASREFAQEPIYGWLHSADMAVLIMLQIS